MTSGGGDATTLARLQAMILSRDKNVPIFSSRKWLLPFVKRMEKLPKEQHNIPPSTTPSLGACVLQFVLRQKDLPAIRSSSLSRTPSQSFTASFNSRKTSKVGMSIGKAIVNTIENIHLGASSSFRRSNSRMKRYNNMQSDTYAPMIDGTITLRV